ncbi:LysR family transcriptional regulator [Gluconobacter wancherniae]|uniref:LysR family transcriptional regulator n=1 Tax=Gluconobacter wancherniae NBRC 103581 TaxID=656744 RepID=A0A511AXY1_9PROT|nr:LysR family transcriptional regulator [Gluconobacter wancherniae]MBF0853198.1 LysR family transcriptional regulator [Gluconobacter wancherniae]GBD56083.1 LysR family transcriptional regulator [Gluconobacter wancherniae NBRC 103581]GBR63162.1 transcriptional regulator [Gluconobacter wancherniae NBRC 103581]GEK93016.1 LysR family transcriptional regulator [Gluconobacter wancherniae NBRC 103581]
MITGRQIEAFHAVFSVGSMTGAARHLGRTQSAVSRLMMELEKALGFTLFERNGTRLHATQEAHLLYDEVKRSFIGLKNIEEKARQIAAGGNYRRITCGATSALSGGLVPQAISGLMQCSSDIFMSFKGMPADDVVRSVTDGSVDIGLATLPIDNANLHIHWIGEASCVAVLHEDHPLAQSDSLSLRQLHTQQVLTVGNPFRLRRTIDAALQASGNSSFTRIETNTSLNAVMSAREELGIAIVEPVTAYGIPIKGTVVRPIVERIPWAWSVLTPAFSAADSGILRFIEQIEITARALLPDFIRHPPEALEKLHTRLFQTEPGAPDAKSN